MNGTFDILLFQTTLDSDLETEQEVCYKNLDGAYAKIGRITHIFESEGFIYYLLSNAMGSYLA